MNATPDLIRVVINPISAQFEALQRAETVGVLTYERVGAHFDLQHTFVAPEHRGRGVAGRLISATLDAIRAAGGTVTPSCSHIRSFVRDNPSYGTMVQAGADVPPGNLRGRPFDATDLNGASLVDLTSIQVDQITTDRIVLRPWSLDDTASAVLIYLEEMAAGSTPPFLGPVKDTDAMRRRLADWITESSRVPAPQGCWAIEMVESGFVAGGAALLNVTDGSVTRLALSVDLNPAFVGQGLASEAGHALVHYAFETSALPAVHAMVRPDDERGIAVVRRLGMSMESRSERQGMITDWYRIARDEVHHSQAHR